MALPVLDAMERRILGSLLEKQVTVPAGYPMTMKSLRTACNQASSRDPVVDYSEQDLERCLRELERRELIRLIWPSGSRTVKYAEALDRVLELDAAERAVLTVLLLRGAQSPGELRTRTDRLHAFSDRDAVAAVLRGLAERDEPLVQELTLRPREQDRRWIHLLGTDSTDETASVKGPAAAEAPPVPDAGADSRVSSPVGTRRHVSEAAADAAVLSDRAGTPDVVAHRSFVSPDGDVTLELHRPVPADDSGYRCHFRIGAANSDSIDGSAHGVDGVEALMLALAEARELLSALDIDFRLPDPVFPESITG